MKILLRWSSFVLIPPPVRSPRHPCPGSTATAGPDTSPASAAASRGSSSCLDCSAVRSPDCSTGSADSPYRCCRSPFAVGRRCWRPACSPPNCCFGCCSSRAVTDLSPSSAAGYSRYLFGRSGPVSFHWKSTPENQRLKINAWKSIAYLTDKLSASTKRLFEMRFEKFLALWLSGHLRVLSSIVKPVRDDAGGHLILVRQRSSCVWETEKYRLAKLILFFFFKSMAISTHLTGARPPDCTRPQSALSYVCLFRRNQTGLEIGFTVQSSRSKTLDL